MILKVGPFSSIFLFHVTSIIRDLPVALHRSSKVPFPADLSGQGWTGFRSGAEATGAGEAMGGVETTGGGVALGADGFGSSLSQATRHAAKAAAPKIPVIQRWFDMLTSVLGCAQSIAQARATLS